MELCRERGASMATLGHARSNPAYPRFGYEAFAETSSRLAQ
jgi:hypothetical protein